MSEHKTAVVEMAASVSSAATKTTYAGAASGFLAYLASVDVLAWLGIAIALAGFIVNCTTGGLRINVQMKFTN